MKGLNKKIQRLDENTFMFETETLTILKTNIQPVITAIVEVDSYRGGTSVIIKSLQLITDDPEVQAKIDKSFTISCVNKVDWK